MLLIVFLDNGVPFAFTITVRQPFIMDTGLFITLHDDLTTVADSYLVLAALDRLRVELKGQAQVLYSDTPPLLQTLVACLSREDYNVRSKAAMLICQLTLNDKPAALYVASFPGAMDALVAGFGLLHPAFSEEFGWALAALVAAKPVHALLLELPRLAVLALASPASQFLGASSMLLFNLCNGNVDLTNACAGAGAFGALLDVAAAATQPPAIRELAMCASGTMVGNLPALATEACVAEHVSVFCGVIAETDDLALQTMWLMALLMKGNARAQVIAGQWNDGALFEALIAKLRADGVTVAVAHNSLACLFKLVKNQPEHQLRLAAIPGFNALLLRLLRCTSERVQGTAAGLVAVFVSGQPAFQMAMAEAVPILVGLLVADKTGAFVQEQSVTALFCLSHGCLANLLEATTASAGLVVDTVSALLVRGHMSMPAQANALMLLCDIFGNEPVSFRFVFAGFKDTLLRIGRDAPLLRGVVDSLLSFVA